MPQDQDLMVKLSESNLELSDPRQDIRGDTVVDRHGDEIGTVHDLYIDRDEDKVRFLDVESGGFLGFGARHVLIPVDAITRIEAKRVQVNQAREHVAQAPAYDPQLSVPRNRSDWDPYYAHYGLLPYWGAGYAYPGFPFYGV